MDENPVETFRCGHPKTPENLKPHRTHGVFNRWLCRTCSRAHNQKYEAAQDREELRVYWRLDYHRNREKRLSQMRAWRARRKALTASLPIRSILDEPR